jgi:hypothetical protein
VFVSLNTLPQIAFASHRKFIELETW